MAQGWDFLLTTAMWPLVILVASGAVAWLLALALGRAAAGLASRGRTRLVGAMLSSLRGPLAGGLVLVGAYLAALLLIPPEAWSPNVTASFRAFLALAGLYAAAAFLGATGRWYAQEVVAGGSSRLGYLLLPALKIAIPVTGWLLAALVVLGAFGVQSEPVNTWLLEHGGRTALITGLTLVGLLAAEHAIPKMVDSAVARRARELDEEARKRADTLGRTLVAASQVALAVLAAFMVIAEVGVNIGPILAGVGVAGIAIGFGTQSLVRDFVGGFFIIFENQYRIGDVVKVGEVAGLVEDLSLRRTVLRDLDGVVHSVPNGDVRVASNFTREWSRVNLNVAVAYNADLDKVLDIINQVGRALAGDPAWAPLILTPPQALGVDYLTDTAMEIKVLGDTRPIRQWEVMGELRKRLKEAFDREGIQIKTSQQGLLRQLALPQQSRPRA